MFLSAGHNYTGFEISTAKEPIKPDRIVRFSVPITVTNEGAIYVTKSTVKCTTA